MQTIEKQKEVLMLCEGAQHNKDVSGWKTLHEFDNNSLNRDLNAKVYFRYDDSKNIGEESLQEKLRHQKLSQSISKYPVSWEQTGQIFGGVVSKWIYPHFRHFQLMS